MNTRMRMSLVTRDGCINKFILVFPIYAESLPYENIVIAKHCLTALQKSTKQKHKTFLFFDKFNGNVAKSTNDKVNILPGVHQAC